MRFIARRYVLREEEVLLCTGLYCFILLANKNEQKRNREKIHVVGRRGANGVLRNIRGPPEKERAYMTAGIASGPFCIIKSLCPLPPLVIEVLFLSVSAFGSRVWCPCHWRRAEITPAAWALRRRPMRWGALLCRV